jgi:hypothetical protein
MCHLFSFLACRACCSARVGILIRTGRARCFVCRQRAMSRVSACAVRGVRARSRADGCFTRYVFCLAPLIRPT